MWHHEYEKGFELQAPHDITCIYWWWNQIDRFKLPEEVLINPQLNSLSL